MCQRTIQETGNRETKSEGWIRNSNSKKHGTFMFIGFNSNVKLIMDWSIPNHCLIGKDTPRLSLLIFKNSNLRDVITLNFKVK